MKVFSAYAQARAASLNKPTLPEKVIESVLIRFEHAHSRKMTVTSATPRTSLIRPLMEMNIFPPEMRANSSEAEVQVTSVAERIVTASWSFNPTLHPASTLR